MAPRPIQHGILFFWRHRPLLHRRATIPSAHNLQALASSPRIEDDPSVTVGSFFGFTRPKAFLSFQGVGDRSDRDGRPYSFLERNLEQWVRFVPSPHRTFRMQMDWREILTNVAVACAYVLVGWLVIFIGDLAAVSWLITDAGASGVSTFP